MYQVEETFVETSVQKVNGWNYQSASKNTPAFYWKSPDTPKSVDPKPAAQPKTKAQPTPSPAKVVTKSGNGNAPKLDPKYLVDNELSSNVPHAAAILNGLHLGGQPASDDNLKLIAKYRELKDGGMDDKHAFTGALA